MRILCIQRIQALPSRPSDLMGFLFLVKIMERKCDVCQLPYKADERNIKRGWGLCCSKSCAAKKRERKKPNYNANRVIQNNIRRLNWNKVGVEGYDEYHIFSDEAFNY